MPPSAVFSYWRRDHRRAPVSSTVPPPTVKTTANSPPQLPAITPAAALSTSYGPSSGPPVPSDYPPDLELEKARVTVSTATIDAPSSSSTNLTVPPSSASESHARPRSSPDEPERDSPLTAQSNSSQPSFTPPHNPTDGDSSKPSSPFRLSFGKSLLTSHSHSSDHSKRSSTSAMAPSSHLRFTASPETSPAEKHAPSQKEYKFEHTHGRRHGERDLPAEHAHHKSGKAMLHLLNPMSLLARRRSSQIAGLRAEEMNIGARNLVPKIPDDYDPRIRGNIVHDFSAPRPRRNLSATPALLHEVTSQANPHDQSQPGSGISQSEGTTPVTEQKKRHSEYSPVFKEHFEEDQRVLQVENKAYLQSSLLTNPRPHDNDGYSIPAFARNLPLNIPEENEEPGSSQSMPEHYPTQEATAQESTMGMQTPPPGVSEDTDTIDIVPHQRAGLPRHLKSNASRFSFDMNGVESSTQEKLLEEKHKEKEAARRAKAQIDGSAFSDDEDDYDNELFDDMDGLEEQIPGVNVDADEGDDFTDFSGPGHIWNKSWLDTDVDPSMDDPSDPDESEGTTTDMQDTPSTVPASESQQDSSIDQSLAPTPLHITDSKGGDQVSPPAGQIPPSTSVPHQPAQSHPNVLDDDDDDLYFDDGEFGDPTAEANGETFDESTFDDETSHLYERKPAALPGGQIPPSTCVPHEPVQSHPNVLDDDDDMYFDDGEFGDLTAEANGETFDESIFDDETSHLYERKPTAPPTAPAQPDTTEADSNPDDTVSEIGYNGDLKHMPSMASEYRSARSKRQPTAESGLPLGPAKPKGGILSEQNLEAFHNALAQAAIQAGTDDRFGRSTSISISERSLGQAGPAPAFDSQRQLIPDDHRLIQPIDTSDFEEVFEDFSYDDNDASFYDDPIIAAANAEALENDDEGFYGQEFGFYAQAHGTNSTELTNGGYFGPRGVEGLTRSFSSRGKFREPSLTPITERSEWSTRNSVISLTAHGAAAHANNPMSSPGLAQLVDMGNIEDEMTLSALLRLRRGAWGGSNGSLRSSSGSPPPQPHTASSNRGSFTGLSDVSPTVYTAPPDFLGGPIAIDSPMREAQSPT